MTQTNNEREALPEISSDELVALLRFKETCDDGECYDVDKSMMKNLAMIGVINHLSAGYYEITKYGFFVLDNIQYEYRKYNGLTDEIKHHVTKYKDTALNSDKYPVPFFDNASPISQNEQQEAVALHERIKNLETQLQNWKDFCRKIQSSPPKQAIPEDIIKDAARYNWLKQNYHGFEMFRQSTIPYVTLDREVDKAMLNTASTTSLTSETNTEVGE